jgi:hypothetical protein
MYDGNKCKPKNASNLQYLSMYQNNLGFGLMEAFPGFYSKYRDDESSLADHKLSINS